MSVNQPRLASIIIGSYDSELGFYDLRLAETFEPQEHPPLEPT